MSRALAKNGVLASPSFVSGLGRARAHYRKFATIDRTCNAVMDSRRRDDDGTTRLFTFVCFARGKVDGSRKANYPSAGAGNCKS